jgi:hypothetical protein
MYEVSHISNLIKAELTVIIPLKELENLLEELQELRKYKRENEITKFRQKTTDNSTQSESE